MRNIGVIDIGKTHVKVTVIDLQHWQERASLKQQNIALTRPPYPHFDSEAHWQFILDSLRQLNQHYPIEAISITTHGASIVLLQKDGSLAAPIMDYEFSDLDNAAAAYDEIRPNFNMTGSPRLKLGLNVGAQIFWQFQQDPSLVTKVDNVLTYPQYWAFRLTGKPATEVTSLGCHTDLWEPREHRYTDLVKTLGIANKMAPLHRAMDSMGPLLPPLAKRTGLNPKVNILCGIHDSNASLYPHLLTREPPFSVISTGTWVIAFAIGGHITPLDPKRDTLMNVHAFGDPVPSARFMGGREFEQVMDGIALPAVTSLQKQDLDKVLDENIMLLPAIEHHSGPYQGMPANWTVPETALTASSRFIAVSFYLALVSANCLKMIGAKGPIILEGPFVANSLYIKMLAIAANSPIEVTQGAAMGTSIGAALLAETSANITFQPQQKPDLETEISHLLPNNQSLHAYANTWQKAVVDRLK